MSAASVIQKARAAGLKLTVSGTGTIKVIGPRGAIERLTPELAANKPAILAELRQAACLPEPRIVREPPFGSDKVPERYLAAWQALLAEWPPGAKPIVWEAAIYDAATLFGDFGTLLVEYGWTAGRNRQAERRNPICHRGRSEKPLPKGHGCVGKFEDEHLPLCQV